MEASFDLGGDLPANSPIEVTFSLDDNGLLKVLAVEPKSGAEFPMEIATSGLTREQIEEIASSALSKIVS